MSIGSVIAKLRSRARRRAQRRAVSAKPRPTARSYSYRFRQTRRGRVPARQEDLLPMLRSRAERRKRQAEKLKR
uniref:Uncharacterized protein n=1 Tax=Thermorudis peleae TaxID=1382356 RepID=A0A831TEY2_9BACT